MWRESFVEFLWAYGILTGIGLLACLLVRR